MDFTTLSRVKIAYETAAIDADGRLSQLITQISGAAEKYLNRDAHTEARTVQLNAISGQKDFPLRAYGDPASVITSVKYDGKRSFSTVTALAATDYYFDIKTGLLHLDVDVTPGFGVVQVIYTAGMALTTAAFVAAYPDIAQAVEQQVIHLHQVRGELGVQSVSFEGGSMSSGEDGSHWLIYVMNILKRHRRIAYGS